jgi:hypothetical protein
MWKDILERRGKLLAIEGRIRRKGDEDAKKIAESTKKNLATARMNHRGRHGAKARRSV